MGGISFLSGLLTGAAGGIQEGRKIKLAREENEIRRQQVEATKALGYAQIQAQSEDRKANREIQMRQLDIQDKLGMGGLGLDWAKLFSVEEQSSLARNHDFLVAAHGNALREGNMEKAAEIEKDMASFQSILNRISKDDDAVRDVRVYDKKTAIDLTKTKALNADEAFYRKEFADYTGQNVPGQIAAEGRAESAKVREHKRELANTLVGAYIGAGFAADRDQTAFAQHGAELLMSKLFETAKTKEEISEAAAAGKKMVRELGGDDGLKKQRARAMMDQFLNAMATDDPNASQQIINAVRDSYRAESQPSGGGVSDETGAAPPGGKPPKPTSYIEYANQNPGKISHTAKPWTMGPRDVELLVFNKPGLKDAAKKAAKEMNPIMSSVPGMITDGDLAKMLADGLNEHPEILGDPATRAAKYLESLTRVRIAPRAPASGSGGAASPAPFRSGR